MSIEPKIRENLLALIKESVGEERKELLDDGTVLLETGLSSLGFAKLVAKLDLVLGYDPFEIMEEPFYPKTYKDFVDIYLKYQPK